MGTVNARILDRRFLIQTAALIVAGAVFFALGYVVRATPGGQTKDSLPFAGTLKSNGQPLIGPQTLTFAFKKAGMTICSPQVMVTPDAVTGSFNTQIDISACPATLFDGSDVTFDLSVGNNVIVAAQPVGAVPYAKYADRVGTPDCPLGYTRDPNAMNIILCKKGSDEMVRVATGPVAFWIDRFEASVWEKPDGTGMQFGVAQDDAHNFGFVRNGEWSKPTYAVSKTGVQPAAWLTWYQMSQACLLSGKRLPGTSEWLAAAHGTADPGSSAGNNGTCVSNANGPRATGGGTACVSVWGAQDMIGNTYEWLGDSGPGLNTGNFLGAEYNNDEMASANGSITIGPALRGGSYRSLGSAGVFANTSIGGPEYFAPWYGFRCAIPR